MPPEPSLHPRLVLMAWLQRIVSGGGRPMSAIDAAGRARLRSGSFARPLALLSAWGGEPTDGRSSMETPLTLQALLIAACLLPLLALQWRLRRSPGVASEPSLPYFNGALGLWLVASIVVLVAPGARFSAPSFERTDALHLFLGVLDYGNNALLLLGCAALVRLSTPEAREALVRKPRFLLGVVAASLVAGAALLAVGTEVVWAGAETVVDGRLATPAVLLDAWMVPASLLSTATGFVLASSVSRAFRVHGVPALQGFAAVFIVWALCQPTYPFRFLLLEAVASEAWSVVPWSAATEAGLALASAQPWWVEGLAKVDLWRPVWGTFAIVAFGLAFVLTTTAHMFRIARDSTLGRAAAAGATSGQQGLSAEEPELPGLDLARELAEGLAARLAVVGLDGHFLVLRMDAIPEDAEPVLQEPSEPAAKDASWWTVFESEDDLYGGAPERLGQGRYFVRQIG